MNKMKNLYIIIIIICLLIISVSIYYVLGGFDTLEVFEMGGADRTVVGHKYTGRHNDPRLDSIRQVIVEDLQSGKLKGRLTLIDYYGQMKDRDSVNLFIGASFDGASDIVRIPAGYDYLQFDSTKIFKIFLSQRKIARPTPEKIYQLVKQKAKETGVVLRPYSFEIYYKDGSLSVEYWVD